MATARMPIRMEIGNHGPIEIGEIEFPARRGELGFVLDWPSVAAALRAAADKLAPPAEPTDAQRCWSCDHPADDHDDDGSAAHWSPSSRRTSRRSARAPHPPSPPAPRSRTPTRREAPDGHQPAVPRLRHTRRQMPQLRRPLLPLPSRLPPVRKVHPMICQPCTKPDHENCASVNCACRHRGSTVRPLTQHERHLLMIGLMLPTVLPVDEPEAFR